MGRSLILPLRRFEEPLLLALAGLVVSAVVVLPLLVLAMELVGASSQPLAPLLARRVWALLGRSLGIAAAVTALALLVGTTLGVILGKTDVVGRRAALLVHAFPMFLPPFLVALGWFHLVGRQGLVGGAATSAALFSEAGVVLILGLTFTPLVTVLVALGLDGIDPLLEEAARTMAPGRRVVGRILLPLVRPGLALGALVVFALAVSELGVPMFLRVDVYPAAVFARLGGIAYSPGEAFALVLPLLVVALALLSVERLVVGGRSFAALGLRGEERALFTLGRWRGPVSAVAWVVVSLSLLPILALAVRAGRAGLAATPDWISGGLVNSLLVSAVAATATLALGVVVGHALVRRGRGGRWVDAAMVLGFVAPASVAGVGLIALWNRPATQAVYGSLAIVVIALVLRYAVIGSRTIATAIAQGQPHLEEAGAAFGARFLRRLFRIVIPVHARAVVAAWLLVFVFCLRDLETAVLLYPPGGATLPVRIFTLEANGPEPVVAGLALVQVAATAAALLLGGLLLRGRRRR